MKKSHTTRKPSFNYQRLEPRQLLAATVYVDFGEGFSNAGGLTISDTQSAANGGPEVFGTNYELSSLKEDFIAASPDLDSAGIDDAIQRVRDKLIHVFEPFDIDVQFVSSSNLSEVADTLASTDTADAYVHVGGQLPVGVSGDIGASVVDNGNTSDNLSFVFSDGFIAQYSRPEAIASAIARQAAVSFGARTTEAAGAGLYNIMSRVGTDESGQPIRDRLPSPYDNVEFVRYELPLTFSNGDTGETSNSLEELQAIVGANPNGKHYFTGTYSTSDYTIDYTGENLIDLTVGDVTWTNIDISVGLELRDIRDLTNFETQTFSLKGKSFDVLVEDGATTFDPNITFLTDLTRSGIFKTDSFDDNIVVNASTSHVFDTGPGNDSITVPYELMADMVSINGGDGDDRFTFTNLELDSEPNFFGDTYLDAGPGNDVLDYSQLEGSPTLHVFDVNEDGFQFGFNRQFSELKYSNFEEALAPTNGSLSISKGFIDCVPGDKNGCTNPPAPVSSDQVETIIDGDEFTMTETEFDIEFPVHGNVVEYWGNNVYLLSTTQNIEITGDNIQISSQMDHTLGTTDTINHDVKVAGSESIIVSNMAGDARQVTISNDFKITGLIGGLLTASSGIAPEIHLSDTGDDQIRLEQIHEYLGLRINVFGHGGNDNFIAGSTLGEHSGQLNMLFLRNSNVSLDGGEGNNYFYLNDEGTELDTGYMYEISSDIVRSVAKPLQRSQRVSSGVRHAGMNVVRLTGTTHGDLFRVEPNQETVIFVEGSSPGAGDGDSLELTGTYTPRSHIVREGQGTGTWYFGPEADANKLILFDGIEYVAQSQRLAVASQAGVPSLVRVFNAQSQKHLFDIRPFPARYTGGVQVETADMNGDSIPDIVVAPGPGRYSLVQIFDGRNGQQIGSFNAFPADNPDPRQNYWGGADIAIGNVKGDSGFEIIASTLTNTHYVRTFTQTAPMEFTLTNGFNVFPTATRAGVRVAAADVDGDGYDDIISTPGGGWLPQIAVHSLVDTGDSNRRQIARFLGNVANYRGGFNVDAGDIDGDGKADIFVSAMNSGSSNDPFSGQLRIFSSSALPQNEGDTVLDPWKTINVFSRATRGMGINLLDTDNNGLIERIDMSVTRGGNDSDRASIRRLDPNDPFDTLGNVFVYAPHFGTGMEI